jgi:hypothetical protein
VWRCRGSGACALLLAAALALLAASGAWADPKPKDKPQKAATRVGLDVTLVHVSSGGGGLEVDPRVQRFDAILGKQLRYDRMKVVEKLHRDVRINEIWKISLPTGRRFQVRPLSLGSNGVLLAVDMDESAQGDFRVPRGKPVVFGGSPYEDGSLVIILETDY